VRNRKERKEVRKEKGTKGGGKKSILRPELKYTDYISMKDTVHQVLILGLP